MIPSSGMVSQALAALFPKRNCGKSNSKRDEHSMRGLRDFISSRPAHPNGALEWTLGVSMSVSASSGRFVVVRLRKAQKQGALLALLAHVSRNLACFRPACVPFTFVSYLPHFVLFFLSLSRVRIQSIIRSLSKHTLFPYSLRLQSFHV